MSGPTAGHALASGITFAGRISGVTFGPEGGLVALHRANDTPLVTKHGLAALRDLTLEGTADRLGMEMIKEAATRLHHVHGDGTAMFSILAAALTAAANRLLAAGFEANDIASTFGSARLQAEASLEAMRCEVTGREALTAIAERAGADDVELAGIVGEAMARVGADGVVTVSYNQSVDTVVTYATGMAFDRGSYSRDLLDKGAAVKLERPLLLLCEDTIEKAAEVIPALEIAKAEQRPLLVIAEAVNGQALATLLANHRAGIVRCAAVKGPGSGTYRHEMTADIALLAGGFVLSARLGRSPASVRREDLGSAEIAIVDGVTTRILEGHGDAGRVKARIAQLRDAHASEAGTYERGKLAQRLARLASGVANIRVGALTEAAWKERHHRAESMVSAARNAMAGGLVAGGGVALHRAGRTLRAEAGSDAIIRAFADALDAPLFHIIRRSGCEPHGIAERIEAAGPGAGFDARRRIVVEDAIAAGLADPFRTVVAALGGAVSTAEQVVRTGSIVARAPRPAKHKGGQNGN